MSIKWNKNIIKVCAVCLLILSASSVQAQYSSGLTVTSNPDGALITITGDAVVTGVTPTTFRQTLIGLYKITIDRYGYEQYNTKVVLDPSKQMELNIQLTPKTRFKSAVRSLVIPGWGQRYSNQKYKGIVYTFFAAASVVGYFSADKDFDTKLNRFRDTQAEYDALETSGSQAELDALYPRLVLEKARAYDAENTRRIAIGSAIAVWSISVLDALFFFPEEKGTFKVKNVTLTPQTNLQHVGLNLSYNF